LGVRGSSAKMGRNNTICGPGRRGHGGRAHRRSARGRSLGQNICRKSWRAKGVLLMPGNLSPHRSRPRCSRVSIRRLEAIESTSFAPPQCRRRWCGPSSSWGSFSSWMLVEAPRGGTP
jgi:hypothetical protein